MHHLAVPRRPSLARLAVFSLVVVIAAAEPVGAKGAVAGDWGGYLVLVPLDGLARRLDMRSLFKGNREFAGTVIYAANPEGFWIGADAGRGFDFVYLSAADVEKRAR